MTTQTINTELFTFGKGFVMCDGCSKYSNTSQNWTHVKILQIGNTACPFVKFYYRGELTFCESCNLPGDKLNIVGMHETTKTCPMCNPYCSHCSESIDDSCKEYKILDCYVDKKRNPIINFFGRYNTALLLYHSKCHEDLQKKALIMMVDQFKTNPSLSSNEIIGLHTRNLLTAVNTCISL